MLESNLPLKKDLNKRLNKDINKSQSVKESKIKIDSEPIRNVVEKNPVMTDRLTDIEQVYQIVKNEPGYSDPLFIATLQKAINARIRVSFAQYLLKAMTNNLHDRIGQSDKKTTKHDLPEWIIKQMDSSQYTEDAEPNEQLEPDQQKEALDLLYQLGEINEPTYQQRLQELTKQKNSIQVAFEIDQGVLQHTIAI